MKHGKNYWEDRYKNNSTGWDLGHPSLPLTYIINNLLDKNSKILIPGAGNSYEAIYLIESGFTNVTVLDIASQPLESIKKQFELNNNIKTVQNDFFQHTGKYDLILEQTFFCALEPRFRESYIEKSHDLLTENGHVKGVLFDFDSQRTEPPYTGNKEEYIKLFENKFDIIEMNRCLTSEDSRKGKELLINMKKK
ncbi:SAM-dependent methyltransferase [Nonlabens sp.]|uniref:SAM-dependent methyltransferase n=1 Tax=Nonlabens sp. TaxID=1888209 RepID=UPI0032653A80